MGRVRLQKAIARSGLCSRRKAEELISSGRVRVNGRPVTEQGTTVDPRVDVIEVDGRRLRFRDSFTYVLLNKPSGHITAVSDTHGRPTVMDVVDVPDGVFPVGRLDKDTTGLLLLTDDGELAFRLMHPRYHVPKTYEAIVDGRPDEEELRTLATGVRLEDGLTAPADVELVEGFEGNLLRLTIREGRKRQVRRMCEAVGHPVLRLRRVAIGPLRDDSLPEGGSRPLTQSEVQALRRAVGLEETS